jgi:transposase
MDYVNSPFLEMTAEPLHSPWTSPPERRPLGLMPSPDSPAKPSRGRLAPFLNLLQGMLETSPCAKIKEFHDALRGQGYAGSYDSVKKRIQALRRDLGRQAGRVFDSPDVPQAQVELAKIVLRSGSIEARVNLFTMVFGYSGSFYAELTEASDMAGFLQCHQNAFEFFGGIPKLVYYDPRECPGLRRLVGGFPFHLPVVNCGHHYGYGVEATPLFAPWMKGRLKRPGKVLRKFFFPGYAFSTLESANQDLRRWIREAMGKGSGEARLRHRVENLGPLPLESFNFRSRQPVLRLRS